jgi:hypothetical protein
MGPLCDERRAHLHSLVTSVMHAPRMPTSFARASPLLA